MSWGTITAAAAPDALEAALNTAADTYKANLAAQDYQLDADADGQITAAIASAVALAKTGVAGALPQASLNGHANPGHAPKAGYSNDTVTVGLYDTSKVPAAPAA